MRPERPCYLAIGIFADVEMRGAAAVGIDHRAGDRPVGGVEMIGRIESNDARLHLAATAAAEYIEPHRLVAVQDASPAAAVDADPVSPIGTLAVPKLCVPLRWRQARSSPIDRRAGGRRHLAAKAQRNCANAGGQAEADSDRVPDRANRDVADATLTRAVDDVGVVGPRPAGVVGRIGDDARAVAGEASA